MLKTVTVFSRFCLRSAPSNGRSPSITKLWGWHVSTPTAEPHAVAIAEITT